MQSKPCGRAGMKRGWGDPSVGHGGRSLCVLGCMPVRGLYQVGDVHVVMASAWRVNRDAVGQQRLHKRLSRRRARAVGGQK
jgi:hypothetical protein